MDEIMKEGMYNRRENSTHSFIVCITYCREICLEGLMEPQLYVQVDSNLIWTTDFFFKRNVAVLLTYMVG